MFSHVEFPPRELSATEQLEKFVSRVWMHPLLNHETMVHRKKGLDFVRKYLDPDCVNQVGFLTGSSLWMVDATSDYDGVIITPANGIAAYYNIARLQEGELFFGIDDSELARHLLFTPDEFLVGDIEYARKLRLKIVSDSNAHKNWQTASAQFRIHGTGWRLFDIHDTTKRINRFNNSLEEYGEQYRNPEGVKRSFIRALNTFTLPSLSTYQSGLMQTEGKLTLSNKYIITKIQKR